MTNAEAIEILRANYPDACYEQLREAVDVAISSLKWSEIVRCKDCKYITEHYDTDGNAHIGLALNGILERIMMDFVIMRKGKRTNESEML